MQSFPVVDPIPLPAPIWLIKLLHIVTLALHFVAVEMLLGGLLIAVSAQPLPQFAACFGYGARFGEAVDRCDDVRDQPWRAAAAYLRRCSTGVRSIHQSVLIGVYWISIIAVLIADLLAAVSIHSTARGWEISMVGWAFSMAAFRVHRPHAIDRI